MKLNNIQTGDIIAWSGTAVTSRIVELFTKSPWSHVGVAVWFHKTLMAIDAYGLKGVRMHPLSHDLDNAFVLPTGLSKDDLRTTGALEWAVDTIDTPYSFQNLWKTYLGLTLIRRKYHCAQFVHEFLTRAGYTATNPLKYPPTPASIVAELKLVGGMAAVELEDTTRPPRGGSAVPGTDPVAPPPNTDPETVA